MRWTRRPWLPRDDIHVLRFVRTVTIAATGSAFLYVAVLWNMRWAPFRTALGTDLYSDFYDLQARALLNGHLHVPEGALGIEAFVQGGREYMYFPPGPALARLPLFLFTSRFDGRLTAVSMLLAWVATVLLLCLLIWRVRRVLRGRAPLPLWEAMTYGALVVAVSAGSVLVYLASQPWVYHEAYAWAIAAALAGAFTLLGVIEKPSPPRIAACAAAVLAGVLVRATTGWALALAVLAAAVWFMTGRHGFLAARYARLLALAAFVPLLVGVGINMAKFSHPYLFPLEDQVWTSVNEQRQAALEANGGDLVSLDILPSTLTAYFRPDGIRFISLPPFVTFPAQPAGSVGGGFLDQTYRTGSAVPFMPALVGLALWGLVTTFRPRGPDRAPWLRLTVLGTGAITGGVLIYGYISYRYLAELLPLLAIASAIGLVDLGHLLMLRSEQARRWFLAVLGSLVGFGVLANSAVAYTTAGYSNPGPALDRYLDAQETATRLLPGDRLAAMTTQADHLPTEAEAEHLLIVGDCAGFYVGQAETFWPWVTVEVRPLALALALGKVPAALTRGPRVTHAELELASVVDRDAALRFERRSDGAYRFVYESPRYVDATEWTRAEVGTMVEVRLDAEVPRDIYELTVDGRPGMDIPLTDFDDEWFRYQNLLEVQVDAGEERDAGTEVRTVPTDPPRRCERLLERLSRTVTPGDGRVAGGGRANPTM